MQAKLYDAKGVFVGTVELTSTKYPKLLHIPVAVQPTRYFLRRKDNTYREITSVEFVARPIKVPKPL